MKLTIEKVKEIDLIERLASIEHDRWSDWHKHCVKNWNVAMVSRWNEQAKTPYSDLSESEKESDRKQVKRYWPLIQEHIHSERIEGWNQAIDEIIFKFDMKPIIYSTEAKLLREIKELKVKGEK